MSDEKARADAAGRSIAGAIILGFNPMTSDSVAVHYFSTIIEVLSTELNKRKASSKQKEGSKQAGTRPDP